MPGVSKDGVVVVVVYICFSVFLDVVIYFRGEFQLMVLVLVMCAWINREWLGQLENSSCLWNSINERVFLRGARDIVGVTSEHIPWFLVHQILQAVFTAAKRSAQTHAVTPRMIYCVSRVWTYMHGTRLPRFRKYFRSNPSRTCPLVHAVESTCR